MAHPLGIPRITLADHARRQEARRLLDEWDEIRKRDAREKEYQATTRPAFNHGLYGKDYGHRRKDD
jgi:hypothetical protein